MTKRALFLLPMIPILALLVSCRKAAPFQDIPPVPREKLVVFGLHQIPNVYSPVGAMDPESQEVMGAMFRPLVDFDENWKLVGVLLENVPDSNKLHVVFELKPRLSWSNGRPLTATDIFFTYQLLAHPALREHYQETLNHIAGMRILNPRKLSVSWTAVAMETSMGFNYVMPMVPRNLMTENFLKAPWFQTPALGNGPFTVSVQEPQGLLLAANRKSLQKPELERVIFLAFPAPEDLTRAVREGRCDVYPTLGPDEIGSLPPSFASRLVPTPQLYVLWFNAGNPILNEEVRRGIFYATPRVQLAQEVGSADAPESWLPPQHRYYKPVLSRYGEDRLKSAWFFYKGGWQMDHPSQRLKNKKGDILSFSCTYNGGDPVQAKLFAMLRGAWGRAGITLEGNPQPPNTYANLVRKGAFSGVLLSTIEVLPTTIPSRYFSSRAFPREGSQGMNLARLKDPEMDPLCDQILSKPEEREAAFVAQQERFGKTLPFMPIGFASRLIVYRKGLTGIKPRGFGPLTWNLESWKWEPQTP